MNNIEKIMMFIMMILIIIVIIICMFVMNFKKRVIEDNQEILENSFKINNKLEKISDINDYIFLKECINKYINYSQNVKNLTEKDDSEIIEDTRNQLKSIIPQFVRDELGVKDEELYEELGIKNKVFRLNKIYQSLQTVNKIEYEENTSISAYYIEGVQIDDLNYEKEEFTLLIILDKINETFLVIPEKYIEMKSMQIEEHELLTIYNQDAIENNFYNVFYMRDISNEEICESYMLDLKKNIIYDIEYLYNDVLDSQYREAKFKNIEEFKQYISQKHSNIDKIALQKYNVNRKQDYNQYMCMDKDDNVYIFKEIGIMDYSLMLDTYTIETEDFIQNYNKSDDRTKGGMNIEKVIEAINNKDYKYVYDHLDETYKNNYFKNINKFEQFIKTKFYDKNNIEYIKITEEGKTLIYNLNIINAENKTLVNSVKIIMKLEDDTNYIMALGLE